MGNNTIAGRIRPFFSASPRLRVRPLPRGAAEGAEDIRSAVLDPVLARRFKLPRGAAEGAEDIRFAVLDLVLAHRFKLPRGAAEGAEDIRSAVLDLVLARRFKLPRGDAEGAEDMALANVEASATGKISGCVPLSTRDRIRRE